MGSKKRRVSIATPEEVQLVGNERASSSARFASLKGVADAFKGFKHASQTLHRVRAVPTIWPQYDLATKVGGHPTERITLLHGESAGGKTYLTLAMILSFIMRDHPAYLIDAERTTPITWVEKTYGEYADHPLFFADRPDTYEEVRANVRRFCNLVRAQREAGKIPKDTTAIIVIDSIRKLVPKDQFDSIIETIKALAKSPELEKARSRITQIKAQMSAAWADELVPLLERCGCALIVIAREIEDPDNTNERARKAGTAVKTTGGKAWFYDASLDLRTTKAGRYGKKFGGEDGEDEKLDVWGNRYCIEITKTKVAGEGDYRAKCFFHISNGKMSPAGFDRAKDLLELARPQKYDRGFAPAIEMAGSWFKIGAKKWQGEERLLAALRDDAKLFAQVESTMRDRFKLEKTR